MGTKAIILPVYNGSPWLPDCLRSILTQNKGKLRVQLSVFNDGSTDDSLQIINHWKPLLEAEGYNILIGGHDGPPRGGTYLQITSLQQILENNLYNLTHQLAMQRIRV